MTADRWRRMVVDIGGASSLLLSIHDPVRRPRGRAGELAHAARAPGCAVERRAPRPRRGHDADGAAVRGPGARPGLAARGAPWRAAPCDAAARAARVASHRPG